MKLVWKYSPKLQRHLHNPATSFFDIYTKVSIIFYKDFFHLFLLPGKGNSVVVHQLIKGQWKYGVLMQDNIKELLRIFEIWNAQLYAWNWKQSLWDNPHPKRHRLHFFFIYICYLWIFCYICFIWNAHRCWKISKRPLS